MADQIPHANVQQEMTAHSRDYDRFLGLMKWGAILSFVTGLLVIMFVL